MYFKSCLEVTHNTVLYLLSCFLQTQKTTDTRQYCALLQDDDIRHKNNVLKLRVIHSA